MVIPVAMNAQALHGDNNEAKNQKIKVFDESIGEPASQ